MRSRWTGFRARMRRRGQSGSAAIEFAFVAPVFFIFLMAIFEAAVIYFSQAALQNAMTDMGRLIRTGQTACYTKDSSGNCKAMTADQFKTMLCGKVSPLVACDSNLQVDVEAFSSGYGSLGNAASPLDSNNAMNAGANQFQLGAACDVVLARAFYTWPLLTPLLTPFLANMAGSKHLMIGTTAFRNEPYTSGSAGC